VSTNGTLNPAARIACSAWAENSGVPANPTRKGVEIVVEGGGNVAAILLEILFKGGRLIRR
jgi:hypothetical protein